MPIRLLLLVVLLIAQIGFWGAIGAIAGVTFSIIVALLSRAAIGYFAVRYWLAKSAC